MCHAPYSAETCFRKRFLVSIDHSFRDRLISCVIDFCRVCHLWVIHMHLYCAGTGFWLRDGTRMLCAAIATAPPELATDPLACHNEPARGIVHPWVGQNLLNCTCRTTCSASRSPSTIPRHRPPVPGWLLSGPPTLTDIHQIFTCKIQ